MLSTSGQPQWLGLLPLHVRIEGGFPHIVDPGKAAPLLLSAVKAPVPDDVHSLAGPGAEVQDGILLKQGVSLDLHNRAQRIGLRWICRRSTVPIGRVCPVRLRAHGSTPSRCTATLLRRLVDEWLPLRGSGKGALGGSSSWRSWTPARRTSLSRRRWIRSLSWDIAVQIPFTPVGLRGPASLHQGFTPAWSMA